jgi:hypothetical protein
MHNQQYRPGAPEDLAAPGQDGENNRAIQTAEVFEFVAPGVLWRRRYVYHGYSRASVDTGACLIMRQLLKP